MCNKRLRALGNLGGWSPKFTLETGLKQCAQLLKMKNGANRDQGKSSNISSVGDSPLELVATDLPIGLERRGVAWVSKVLPDQTQLVALVEGDLTRTSTVAARCASTPSVCLVTYLGA